MPPWCWFFPDLHWPSLPSRAPGTQPKCHALSSWPHIHCMDLEIFNLWNKTSPQSGSAPQTRSFPLSLWLPLIYPVCATCDLLQAPRDVFFHKRQFFTQKQTDYITVSMKDDIARRTLFFSSESSGHGDLSFMSPRKKKNKPKKTMFFWLCHLSYSQ